jgi:hypothetical protein
MFIIGKKRGFVLVNAFGALGYLAGEGIEEHCHGWKLVGR